MKNFHLQDNLHFKTLQKKNSRNLSILNSGWRELNTYKYLTHGLSE